MVNWTAHPKLSGVVLANLGRKHDTQDNKKWFTFSVTPEKEEYLAN